jgi:hypothetical protein
LAAFIAVYDALLDFIVSTPTNEAATTQSFEADVRACCI